MAQVLAFFDKQDKNIVHGVFQKKKTWRKRVSQRRSQQQVLGPVEVFLSRKNLKLPQSDASPGVFFARQDKTIVHGVFKKKKDVADKCILEAITTTSFGTGRGVSVKKKN